VRGLLLSVLLTLAPVARSVAADQPRDVPYPGLITLEVDATDIDRHIFNVRESVPVHAGALTLYYPEWIPGYHAPLGSIQSLAGLVIEGNGRRIEWRRNSLDVHAFQLTVPAGVKTLELQFQFLSPQTPDQGRVVMTPEILIVAWETVLLYPAGHYASRIRFAPTLRLPEGWWFATALPAEQGDGRTVRFDPTTLETLVDSPVFAGLRFSRVDLDPGARVPVYMNVFVDEPGELQIEPEFLAAHRRLVHEAIQLFGPPHFARYDFLFAVSY